MALCGLLVLLGCVDIPKEGWEPRVTPEFNPDPVNPAVPQPIDIPGLTRDPATGRVMAPIPGDAARAFRELFEGYVNTLDGWAANSTPSFTFSGLVDPATVHAGTVRVFVKKRFEERLAPSDIPFSIVVDTVPVDPGAPDGPRKTAVTLIPARALDPGALYAVAVVGNTPDGILAADGSQVTTPFAFTFLKSTAPLIRTGTGRSGAPYVLSNIVLPADSPEDIEVLLVLEGIRQGYAPLLEGIADSDALGAAALPTDRVVLFWTFTTQSDTIALFDPLTATIPAPNDLLFEGDTLAFPIDPEVDSPAQVALFEWMNTLDGFSVLSAPMVGFSQPLDPATVTEASVRVFDVTDPTAVVEIDWVTRHYDEAARHVVIEPTDPREPFDHGHRYAVVALSSGSGGLADTQGGRVLRSQAMALALLGAPLLGEDGRSTLPGVLGDDDAAQFEAVRQGYAALLTLLAADHGVSRDEVASLWTFTIGTQAESLVQPSMGLVPTPNALALDAALLADLIANAQSSAERGFFTWLREQGGWSAVINGEALFSRALDPTTFGPSLHVLEMAVQATKVDGVGFVLPEDDGETTRAIEFFPAPQWKPGTTYMVLVTDALRTVAGEPVLPSNFQVLTRGRHPLFQAGVGSLVPAVVSDADAQQLEFLRIGFGGLLDRAAGAVGIERENVLAHWTFTTHGDNEALFSPVGGVIPFPNELLQNRELDETGPVPRPAPGIFIPPVPGAGPVVARTLDALRALDGFSVLSNATTRFSKPLATESLTTAATVLDILDVGVAFADLTDVDVTRELTLTDLMAIQPVVGTRARFDAVTNVLSVGKPQSKPLRQNRRYMVALTDRLESVDESPIRVSPTFWFARNPDRLATSTDPATAESRVMSLTDAQAAELEGLRQAYEPMFLGFDMVAQMSPLFSRESVIQFWTFWTQDITGPLERLAVELTEFPTVAIIAAPEGGDQAGNPSIDAIVAEDPAARLTFADPDKGRYINVRIPGKSLLTAPDFRDGNNPVCGPARPPLADGTPAWEDDEILVDVYLPLERPEEGIERPFPVTLFVHGVGGNKYDVLRGGLANRLLEEGFVVISVDLPLHGGRRCAYCFESGQGFLCDDAVAMRDNFLQAAVDLHQVARYIQDDHLNRMVQHQSPRRYFDEDRYDDLSFVGTSLGAMVGTLFVTTNPHVRTVVLNTPGAHFARFVEENTSPWLQGFVRKVLCAGAGGAVPRLCQFNPEATDYLCFAPEPGCDVIPWRNPAIRELLSTLQWLLDRADPLAYAPYLFEYPLFDVERRVLIQAGEGDEVFPLPVVRALYDAMWGEGDLGPAYEPYPGQTCHAFLLHGCPDVVDQDALGEQRRRARNDIAYFLRHGALPY